MTDPADQPSVDPCPECRDLGWLLNDLHTGHGHQEGPLTLDLLPCVYPGCGAGRSPRPIATLGIRGQLADVVRHPVDGTVMALSGFTQVVWR